MVLPCLRMIILMEVSVLCNNIDVVLGGRKCKGGKAPRSPWGWKTKGWRTVRGKKRFKWYTLVPRWEAKKAKK